MFGFPQRATSLCLRALLEIFSLSLGGGVSDRWGVWGSCCYLCRLSMSSRVVILNIFRQYLVVLFSTETPRYWNGVTPYLLFKQEIVRWRVVANFYSTDWGHMNDRACTYPITPQIRCFIGICMEPPPLKGLSRIIFWRKSDVLFTVLCSVESFERKHGRRWLFCYKPSLFFICKRWWSEISYHKNIICMWKAGRSVTNQSHF